MTRRARGFTLIEMLVAVVIFMVFISAVYGIYAAAHSAMARAEEQEAVYQTGRVLLAQLNTELTCAYQSATATVSSLDGEDLQGTDETPADSLVFVTTGHRVRADLPVGDRCELRYSVGGETPDEPGGLYLEANPHPGLEVTDEMPERRLLSPLVAGMNCRYLPADGGDWVDEWQAQTTLPVAVRVELLLRPERAGAAPVALVTTANLMLATAPAAGGADDAP